jgi:deazaflavin-dependent oxidoreductase (nitroreductase family)
LVARSPRFTEQGRRYDGGTPRAVSYSLATMEHFLKPSPVERVFNHVFGAIVSLGGGLAHNYVLQVVGRKSGRTYQTPVNLLDYDGKRWLVAPRGNAQWVYNAKASGTVTLKKGRESQAYRVRPVELAQRPPVLKRYLEAYKPTVQRYFDVQAGAPESEFLRIADQHPVFELLRVE